MSVKRVFVIPVCATNQELNLTVLVSSLSVYAVCICKLLVVCYFCSTNQEQNPVSLLNLCLHMKVVLSIWKKLLFLYNFHGMELQGRLKKNSKISDNVQNSETPPPTLVT